MGCLRLVYGLGGYVLSGNRGARTLARSLETRLDASEPGNAGVNMSIDAQ